MKRRRKKSAAVEAVIERATGFLPSCLYIATVADPIRYAYLIDDNKRPTTAAQDDDNDDESRRRVETLQQRTTDGV